MAIKTNDGEIDERPTCKSHLKQQIHFKHISLMVARFMDAMNHQTPCNEQRLGYQTGQTICSGQIAQQNVGRSLQRSFFDNCYDDSQVSKKRNEAEWYVDDTQHNVMYEGGSVVTWDWYPERQATNCTASACSHFCKPIKNEIKLKITIQKNPDFSNPRFLEPPDNSNQLSFPLDLLHSNTVILPPISRTLYSSKLPQTRTNSWLPWEKFPEKLPSITRTLENF